MRALVAVLIVVLAAAPAFALKASHHRYKRAAKNATITNVETAAGRRTIRTTSRSIEDREHLPGMR
jgi:hypothetical protein